MRLSTSLRLNAQKGLVTPYDPALTLDLQFAARQAYVANIGPLPTFTNASTTRTFVGSNGLIQTAATNVPRIDFDPVTRLCRGLLIEEQRTNLYTHSGDFLNAVWGTGYTKTGGFTAPDGSASAVQFSGASASISSRTIVTTANTVVISIWFKDVSRSQPISLLVRNDTTGTNLSSALYNVATGALISPSPAASWSVTQFPNGWHRVTLVQSTGISVGDSVRFYYGNSGAVPDQGAYLLWGAQFEAGSFATSYIPTTTTSLTRSTDVCSITGAAFTGFWNAAEGTIALKMQKAYAAPATISQLNYLSINDGTGLNYIQFAQRGQSPTGEVFRIENGGTSQALIQSSTSVTAANTPLGIAGVYKSNDARASCNGAAVVSDSTVVVPTVTQLQFVLVTSALWISSLQYYNTIKTNAQLQALSTP
jgi:hypothetical protein